MKRIPVVLALALAACQSLRSPYGPVRPPDECGDPARVSQSYALARGKVVEVAGGDRIAVDFPAGPYQPLEGRETLRLVDIEAPALDQPVGQESKARLEKRLLGRQVDIWLSPYQEVGKPVNVMVYRKGEYDVDENRGQLEAGMARFIDQGPYAVDSWLGCHYERAEQRAKAAHRGLWR